MASQEVTSPKVIKFDTIVVDLCFHPEKDVIACGLIEGDIKVYSYSVTEQNHELLTFSHHKKSCRGLRFSPMGNCLHTISKDKTIQTVDMDQGTIRSCIKDAHDCPLYSMYVVDDNILTTGDEDGMIKVWDLRQQKAVMALKENDDFISDMYVEDAKRQLIATSGDGTLTAFDIRKHKMKMQSELFDSELLSLAVIKRQGKVVCGSGEGVLNIFNWNEWGNMTDRIQGHPMSVDCMVPISEDVIVTGSMDGVLRAVHILPNRILGKVGSHEEFPVENISKSRCGNYLASCSHDQKVKFWNIEQVLSEKVDANQKVKKATQNKVLATSAANSDFFADMVEKVEENCKDDDDESEDSDSDSEDSDEEGEEGGEGSDDESKDGGEAPHDEGEDEEEDSDEEDGSSDEEQASDDGGTVELGGG